MNARLVSRVSESFCFEVARACESAGCARGHSPDTGSGSGGTERSSRKREGLCGTRTCSYLIFFKRVVVKNKSRVRACQLALYTRHARSVPNLGEQKPQPHEKPSLALRPAGTTSRRMNTDSEARLLPGERRLRLW